MHVYDEITQLAHKNDEIKKLIAEIVGKVGWDSFDWLKGNFIQTKANEKARDEIAQLDKKNQEFQDLITTLDKKIDTEGMDFKTTKFIEDCREENGHLFTSKGQLDNQGLIDETYYCYQESGYMEDDEVGTMYFKTETPSLFVAIDFDR